MNIFLAMPPSLSPALQNEWLDFMERVGADSRDYQERHPGKQQGQESIVPLPWRLLILVPSHFASPKPETSLEIFLASGLSTQSDLEYAIETCVKEYNISKTSSRLWLSAICQGLGVRDVSLCQHIFKKLPISEEEMMRMLRSYPFPRLDREMKACVIAIDEASDQKKDFGRQKKRLQYFGILDLDCGGEENLHPSALAAANRPNAIYRMLLQGQIRTYMPLVQEVQTFIHNRLGQLCGPDWHKREPEKYPGLDMEIGPLARYMSTYLKGECGSDLLELAHLWRILRHKIAHGNLVSLEDTKDAVDLYEMLRKGDRQFS